VAKNYVLVSSFTIRPYSSQFTADFVLSVQLLSSSNSGHPSTFFVKLFMDVAQDPANARAADKESSSTGLPPGWVSNPVH
jgi:hypothetical protein